MSGLTFLKRVFTPLLLVGLLLAAGCSKSPSGKYADDNGMTTVTLDSGKATVSLMGQSQTGDYTMDGDKVTVKVKSMGGSDSLVLTYDPKDDTLSGPMGTKLKKSK